MSRRNSLRNIWRKWNSSFSKLLEFFKNRIQSADLYSNSPTKSSPLKQYNLGFALFHDKRIKKNFKKRLQHSCLSVNIAKFFKNIFFYRTSPVAASKSMDRVSWNRATPRLHCLRGEDFVGPLQYRSAHLSSVVLSVS